MPRNLALGNGHLLVAFDQTHRIRDFNYPHVGQSNHALSSGVLAEQVDPHTNEPLSVSPLTWRHATFVAAVQSWLAAQTRLGRPGQE